MPSLQLALRQPSPTARAVAVVQGPGPAQGRFLWLDADAAGGAARISLPSGNFFTLEPSHDPNGRMLVGAFSASGGGKSTQLLLIAQRFHALWPDRPVVLVTSLKERDETLESVPWIRRLSLQSLVDSEITLEELRGSMLLLDDVEMLPLAEENAVRRLRELVLTQGRHAAVSMCIAAHNPNTGARDRTLHNELQAHIVMPHGLSYHSLKYLLEKYDGLSPADVKTIRSSLGSRWAAVLRNFPTCIVHEHGAYLPHSV